MPKIFLIKNRLLQQQQRLLESQKQLAAVDINADEAEVPETETEPVIFINKSRFLYQSNRDGLRKSSNSVPEPISDEPLSLVIHKGQLRSHLLIRNYWNYYYIFTPWNYYSFLHPLISHPFISHLMERFGLDSLPPADCPS